MTFAPFKGYYFIDKGKRREIFLLDSGEVFTTTHMISNVMIDFIDTAKEQRDKHIVKASDLNETLAVDREYWMDHILTSVFLLERL